MLGRCWVVNPRQPDVYGTSAQSGAYPAMAVSQQGIADEPMPWEARVVPRREKLAEWLAETGVDKWMDLIQIVFRYV